MRCRWKARQLLAAMPAKGSFRVRDLAALPDDIKRMSPAGIGGYLAAMEEQGLVMRAGREACAPGTRASIIMWTLTDLGREIKGGL